MQVISYSYVPPFTNLFSLSIHFSLFHFCYKLYGIEFKKNEWRIYSIQNKRRRVFIIKKRKIHYNFELWSLIGVANK